MTKEWIYGEDVSSAKREALAKELNVNNTLSSILLRRGIFDFNSAKSFFRPTLEQLHDPFLMKDLDVAVNRLGEAVFNKEKILIYGDYDVDGTTSVALVYQFLKNFTDYLGFYIPDRYTEGYGISERGVQYANEEGYGLMIALDCGIRANEQVELANELGVDFIICDHHLPSETLPEAIAVLDPKRPDCSYPYKELSGCGGGFKLLQGFCLQNTIPFKMLLEHLDLLLVSIAADIVPLTGENRVLAHFGLKKINHSPSVGLKALMTVGSLKNKLSISNVVFGMAPRINAAGRIGHAEEAVKLLIAQDFKEALRIAQEINIKNAARKDLDKQITEEAISMIEEDESLFGANSTVLYKNDWHKGVIGIVASRCIEKYYKPTIIMTSSDKKVTGSARSVEGFDVHQAITECADYLEQFGGHKYAAGLTLKEEDVDAFKAKFEEVVTRRISEQHLKPKLYIDDVLTIASLTFKFQEIINQMGPFGPLNLQPVFSSHGLTYIGKPMLLKGAHIKMTVTDDVSGKNIDAIAFGFGDMYDDLIAAKSFDLAYSLDINEFMGNKSLQLMVKDIKL